MRERHNNVHLDTGAFVMDALPEPERIAFEDHLDTCESCRIEVGELAATAARMGGATAGGQPPDELRERVMRAIRSVRQEGPPPARPLWSERLRRRVPPVAVAASLAVAAVCGGAALWQHEQAQDARSDARQAQEQIDRQGERQAQVTQVLTAPDARSVPARFAGGGAGTLVVSTGRDQAVFVVSGMPAPPAGSVYQLWYDRGGHMAPAGLMAPGQASGAVLLTGGVQGAGAVGVTVEPDGGSPQPTSPPVALIELPA